MTPDQLQQILPSMPREIAVAAAGALSGIAHRFPINTPVRQACFVGQALHESNGFTRMTENLNYGVDALLRIWPKRFTPERARLYGRIDGAQPANQQMIANVAYACRMGNGSIESGDGWRYRGRGPGQLTGRDNYAAAGRALGLDLVNSPDQVAQIETGLAAFAWFWMSHNLNQLADAQAVDRISVVINGGDLGLDSRRELTEKALEVLS